MLISVFVHGIIKAKFGKIEIDNSFMWEKNLIKKVLINVNLDNIIISKLVKTKTNSKYLIGYLDELDK